MESLVRRFERELVDGWIASSSFQDIVNGRLKREGRIKQVILFLVWILLALRLGIICFLYLCREEVRLAGQRLLIDYIENAGIVGRMVNFSFFSELFVQACQNIVVREHELTTSMHCWTFLITSIRRQEAQYVKKFELFFKYTFFPVYAMTLVNTSCLITFEGVSVVLSYLHERSVSRMVQAACIALFMSCIMRKVVRASFWYCYTPVLVTKKLKLDIEVIGQLIEDLLKEGPTVNERQVTLLFHLLTSYRSEVEVFNYTIRHIISNLLLGSCAAQTVIIYFFVANMHPLLKALILNVAIFYVLVKTIPQFYMARLYHEVEAMHNQLHTFYSRCLSQNSNVSYQLKIRLQRKMKGLLCPHNPATLTVGSLGPLTTGTVLNTISVTFSLTLLVL